MGQRDARVAGVGNDARAGHAEVEYIACGFAHLAPPCARNRKRHFIPNGVEIMRTSLILTIALLLPCPALACSLCGSLSRSVSLLHEFDQAHVIVYGRIANPKLELKAGLAGGGTTEFHVEKMLKDDPAFPRTRMILLNRYLPILDAKVPSRYVMFFKSAKDAQPYTGRQITSPALLDFMADLQRYGDDPLQRLLLAGKQLDNADAQIADEAFLVFAKADDKLVGQAAKRLAPATLRKLVKTPELEPERLSMYAYLLGACGEAGDADLLRSLLTDLNQRNHKAFEGILAGYITMRPKEGWTYTHDLLKDEKTPFLLRYASLRTLRFFYNARPEETAANVIHGLGLAIQQAELSDIAITDLRNWKRWDHSKLILSCYDKKSHHSQIVKNSIVRYALACPQPEARALVERARRQEPELVKYLEEELK
jgi:hypothetical protein